MSWISDLNVLTLISKDVLTSMLMMMSMSIVSRLVAFLHASEQYQLALPLVGLAVEWQWRMKIGELRQSPPHKKDGSDFS